MKKHSAVVECFFCGEGRYGSWTVINFGKPNEIGAYGRFWFAILLGPPSKEEVWSNLRTGILPHSRSASRSEKERANNRLRMRNRMKNKKKALTMNVRALSFCGVGGVRTLVQTMVPNVFYMLIFWLVFVMDSDKNTQDPTLASKISHLVRSSRSARFSKMIPLSLLAENQSP